MRERTPRTIRHPLIERGAERPFPLIERGAERPFPLIERGAERRVEIPVPAGPLGCSTSPSAPRSLTGPAYSASWALMKVGVATVPRVVTPSAPFTRKWFCWS